MRDVSLNGDVLMTIIRRDMQIVTQYGTQNIGSSHRLAE
jgi:hypothetical protein